MPSTDSEIQPFHRKYLIQGGWALAVGIVLFAVGAVWQSHRAPESVRVVNQDTVTRVVVVPDSVQRRLTARMLEEIVQLRLATIGARRETLRSPDSNSATSNGPLGPNPVQVPEVALPLTVRGYVGRDLSVFASSTCPNRAEKFGSSSDVTLSLTMRLGTDSAKLSPIHVTIVKRTGPKDATQVFEQQYQLRAKSLLKVPVPKVSGDYELDFGVYVLAELTTPFPSFYRRTCALTVQ